MKLVIGFFLLLFVVSCTSSQEVATDSESSAESSPLSVKEFTIIAKNFAFEPSTITVQEGDTVILHVTSMEGTHGYAIRDYNIDLFVEQGKTETVEFIADKKGTFTTRCSVPCGSGHSDMKGVLVVE